jgi:hypothetical protein
VQKCAKNATRKSIGIQTNNNDSGISAMFFFWLLLFFSKGIKSFQILPKTFVMPYEIDDFYSTFNREKGFWIVKPVASSRGRGIFLINHVRYY